MLGKSFPSVARVVFPRADACKLALAAVAVTVVAGGCGGSGGTGPAAAKRVAGAGYSFRAPGDWQVRRRDSGALVEQAARALSERPDDDGLARRLVGLTDKAGRERLRASFRQRADAEPGHYGAVAAYARLLLALGDGEEAGKSLAHVILQWLFGLGEGAVQVEGDERDHFSCLDLTFGVRFW